MRLCLARVVTPRLMRAICQTSLLETVGGPELHPRRVGVSEHFGAAVLADVLGVVADQPVALAGDAMLQLAGRRELEALLDAAFGLELGHFRLLVARRGFPRGDVVNLTRQPSLAGPVVFPMIWKEARL